MAKRVKKPRTLRSLEILLQRSAVPALSSKATAPPAPKTNKAKVSHADKERLRRIARKTQVGSDGQGLGSAVISVRKTEPLRDVWTERESEAQRLANVKGKWEEVVEPQPAPKAPLTIEQQRQIHAYTAQTKSVPVPRDGQSYNPKLESHQTLLDAAIAQEIALLKKETDAEKKLERYKQMIQNRRQVAQEDDADLINGMMVAAGDPEALAEEIGLEVEDIGDGSDSNEMGNAFAKPTRRKTQAEKNKAKRRIEQARLAKQAATIKQQRKSMEILSKLKSSVEASAQDRARVQAARRAAKQAERLTGYQGGEKVGKHRVLEDSIDVQLGEDLSENVREIKPEGNLFRERFRSMQSRSLVEPRVRQLCVLLSSSFGVLCFLVTCSNSFFAP